MFLNKLKFVAVVVLALGLVGSGVGLFGRRGDAQLSRPRYEGDKNKENAKEPEARPRPKADKREETATPLKKRAALAEKCYQGAREDLGRTQRSGNILTLKGKPEDVYLWSVRWLQAERELNPKREDQIAALEGHLKRMTELRKLVEELVRDLLPRSKMDEAEWYQLEAEVWLARAKAAR